MTESKTTPPRTVSCPQCGRAVVWGAESPYRPFCSERCKLIDIGAWASGQYFVAGEDEIPGETDRNEA
ncbi:MAG: hypothetical protein H6R19_2285 [Proteobacteria bacterium]|nr:hypothetical protein [Pseudomonadota bacterium]